MVELGPRATGVDVGDRVVLNPWLTCRPRGIDPVCPACRSGDLSLCWSFTTGELGPGVHVGVATGAPGAWAELVAAHDSMLVPVPDAVPDELAVLADPFAVSMHAIVRHPPPPGGRALVYGAGALGATSVAALRALFPDTEVGVVARFGAQADLARRLGPDEVFAHEPRLALVEALAAWSGGVLHVPFDGLPITHPGGIDVVYDTVARPETMEVAVRVLRGRGTLVQTGVHTGPVGVDAHLLQGVDPGRLQRLRYRRGGGDAPTRAGPLSRSGDGGSRRPDRHADPPVRAGGLVGGGPGHRPSGDERRHQGGLRARPGSGLTDRGGVRADRSRRGPG